MDCSCKIYYDGEFSESLCEKIVTARKRHFCNECGFEIKKGEQYNYERYIYDGYFCTHKTCLDCLSLRKSFFVSWRYGFLWQEIKYQLQGDEKLPSVKCMSGLTKNARDKVCDIIEGGWVEQ